MSEMHHDHELEMKKALRPTIEHDTEYWETIEQLNNNPEFAQRAQTEFMSSPLREEDGNDGFARREFLKLMGASLAMATAGCIRRPVQKIVPYNKMPEEVTLGTPNYYTSAYFDGVDPIAVLIKTREGRPIKVEATHGHPFSGKGLNIRSQASLLNLYDPERLQGPRHDLFNEKKSNSQGVDIKWEELDKKVVEQLGKGGVVILTGPIASPSTRAVISDFAQGFKAKHVVWNALSNEDVVLGQKASYGEEVVPAYHFDKAKMIVSVDADFLGTWGSPTAYTNQFVAGRKDIKNMNRLVSFDSTYSLTGANADIRVKIKPSQQLDVVLGLLHEIIVKKGASSYAGNGSVKAVLAPYSDVAKKLNVEPELFAKVAADLLANKGQSLVVAGGMATLTEDSKNLQIAVNFLNSVLENEGKTVDKAGNQATKSSYEDMAQLVKDMADGKVTTLIIHGVNPGFVLPAEFGFGDAVKKVKMVLYTGDRVDETGARADYIIPDNHFLESWNDMEIAPGVFTVCQPAIRPMYDTRSFQLSLMNWAFMAKAGPQRLRDYETFYDYLRVYWKTDIHPKVAKGMAFEDFWQEVLQKGHAGEMVKGAAARSFKVDAFTSIKPAKASEGYELVLYPTSQMGDGSLGNVPWLYEIPDPITKVTWDNYASISLATAEKHHLKQGSVISLKVGDKTVELPVYVQPGMHDDVVAVAVGYGRTKAGKVGNGVGQNTFALMTVSKEGKVTASGMPVTFTKLSKTIPLATTSGNFTMEGRQIVASASLKDYQKSPRAGIKKYEVWSIWSGHQYSGHKWGMAVDLHSCTGCSSCVVACQSENNIPVIGKKYVLEGRIMHWMRIDRYYTGDIANAEAVFQPVMCQHCDNAPCETVCPVIATSHSDEGLNDMVYNRCVGTRYCANNCPYKVRRFNWFNYAKLIEKPMHMALNPSVGVRTRGVMEKCTFCVQRIHDAKTLARNEQRQVKDGDVKTACQTSCPASAIVFGDVNDPNSEVAKIFKTEERGYALLEEWHAKPSVRYLSKIRNNDKETVGGQEGHGTAKQGEHS
ncbi:MAG TPA: TAT-variant-translocated molybdopterin oxidoreductase [Bdellovibrio sp.]|uniref:TAT-variant-translocated molybdopterin oxidoreductase n=1 Tax=Bdellovibrio sp. TaxID=28201 RepID=UPI002EEE4B0B